MGTSMSVCGGLAQSVHLFTDDYSVRQRHSKVVCSLEVRLIKQERIYFHVYTSK